MRNLIKTLFISGLTLVFVWCSALAQEIIVQPFGLRSVDRTFDRSVPDPTFIQGVDDPFNQRGTIQTFGIGTADVFLPAEVADQNFARFGGDPFTSIFPIRDCFFVTQGTNNFFDISAGRQLRFDNFECFQAGECLELRDATITALNETRNIIFEMDGQPVNVDTRVILTEEMVNGRPALTERNFLAECQGTGDVFNFGRNVQIFAENGTVSTEGSWLAGQNGALPGLIFPGGSFLSGARFFQEIAPGVALKRSENLAVGLNVEVPAGTFEGCVQVQETTPLDPTQISTKFYCPGVGLVADEDVVLIEASGGALGNPVDGLSQP